MCCVVENWLDELGATKADVAETLMGKGHMRVKNIRTSHLLTLVRVAYSAVQYIVLPRNGNIDIMSEVDQMVMFCLMTRRRINQVRLTLDFIIFTINVERRRYTTLPYGMFLTKVFIKAQLPLDGERCDKQSPTTTMKTFLALGRKPKDKEKERKNKNKKDDTATTIVVPSTKKK